jgi:hypothetical protein
MLIKDESPLLSGSSFCKSSCASLLITNVAGSFGFLIGATFPYVMKKNKTNSVNKYIDAAIKPEKSCDEARYFLSN